VKLPFGYRVVKQEVRVREDGKHELHVTVNVDPQELARLVAAELQQIRRRGLGIA
jgi:hypothetical protein